MTSPEQVEYEPPTPEEWLQIDGALSALGFNSHVEGGGAAATHIWIDLSDGAVALLGDNGDFWALNLYANVAAFENGEDFGVYETDVPTKPVDGTDHYHDPESIADAVRRVLEE